MDPTQKQNDVLGNQPSVNSPSGVGYPPVAGSQPVVSDGSSVGNSPVPDTRPLMVNQSLVGDSPTVSSQSPMGVSNTGGLMDAGGVNGPVGVGISNQPVNAGQFGGLNNIGNQSVPMSTGTGDIILAPEKKSKKWWIVGAVGVTCIVGIIVAVGIMWASGVVGGSKNDFQTAFNRFANYVLYGEEKETEINTDLDISYDYFFNNNTSNSEIYERMENSLVAFVEKYDRYKGEQEVGNVDTWIKNERDLLGFMKVVYPKDRLSIFNLLDEYLIGGREKALELANNYYMFDTEENTYSEEFKNAYDDWVNVSLDMLDHYYNNGCLRKWGMDYDCITNGKEQGSLSELNEKESNLQRTERLLDSYYELSNDFSLGVFVLNAYINNGDVSLYVTTAGKDGGYE